jgi:hypothetical protein
MKEFSIGDWVIIRPKIDKLNEQQIGMIEKKVEYGNNTCYYVIFDKKVEMNVWCDSYDLFPYYQG